MCVCDKKFLRKDMVSHDEFTKSFDRNARKLPHNIFFAAVFCVRYVVKHYFAPKRSLMLPIELRTEEAS